VQPAFAFTGQPSERRRHASHDPSKRRGIESLGRRFAVGREKATRQQMPPPKRPGSKDTPVEQTDQEHRQIDLGRSQIAGEAGPVCIGPVDDREAPGVGQPEDIPDSEIAMQGDSPFRVYARITLSRGFISDLHSSMDGGQRTPGLLQQLGTLPSARQQVTNILQLQPLERDLPQRIVEGENTGDGKKTRHPPDFSSGLGSKPLPPAFTRRLGLYHFFAPDGYRPSRAGPGQTHRCWVPDMSSTCLRFSCGTLATSEAASRVRPNLAGLC
jgi:hypothetical protein